MRLLSLLVRGSLLFSRPSLAQGSSCSAFDVREASIDTIHDALYGGLTTCRGLVEAFIARIQKYNRLINAIITLNPDALSIADALDLALAAGNASGALFCVPILLKDNYDALGMNTTGGCLDLANSQPTNDAPVVVALKRAGGIILGKTNLHELALEGLSVSSLGGQTFNPYDLSRTPGGSSGGTGAAIAASFAVFGTGTDTVNSLRSPASANSLFSVRPTPGLISRGGIIPISYTQDAVGPIARNVNDLAVALNVMASVGYDPNDNATALVPSSSVGTDYSTASIGGSFRAVRLGLIETFFNRTVSEETTPVIAAINATVFSLTAAGATIVPISSSVYNSSAIIEAYDTQRYEYRQEMNEYLTRSSLHGEHPANLNDLYKSEKFLVIPSQYSYVSTALVSSADNATYSTRKLGIQNLILALQSTFKEHSLDALIYPEQANLVVKIGAASQAGRNGILAAVTGFPVVTVPAGFSPATKEAPVGIPIGMEILGMPWNEAKLLNIARRVSEVRRVRKMPVLTEEPVHESRMERVPVIVPDTKSIPISYPLGTL